MSETDNLQGLDHGQLDEDKIGTAQKFNQLLRGFKAAVAAAANTILTTRGDLLTRDASALKRLAVGGANTVLKSDGTDPAWGQVQTAMIADDAVTLAKQAHGTAGNVPTFDASGAPAVVATGTTGQVLTSNGAGAAPTMQTKDIASLTLDDVLDGAADSVPYRDAGEGVDNKATLRRMSALGFLEQQTASSSAQIDFALDGYTEYRHFLVDIEHLIPATDAQDLWALFSTDGGSTFANAAGNYSYAGLGETTAAFITNVSASAAQIELNGSADQLGNQANEYYNAKVWIKRPNSTAQRPTIRCEAEYSSAVTARLTLFTITGNRLNAEDITDIRFRMASGNITSGTFTLYGIRG